MSKPRVLLVMHELTMAGASRLALSTFRELADDVDLRIVANRPGALRKDFAELGHLTVLRDGLAPRATRRLLGASEAQELIEGVHGRLRSRVLQPRWRGLRPDVVYLNSVAALPVYARMPWVRRIGCPTILHVHELEVMIGEFERIAPGMTASVPNKYVAVSQAVRQALESVVGVAREQIVVVPAHIDRHWTEDGVPVPRLGGRDETFVVGGSGIPSWMKGVELWLLTASELVRTQGRTRFRFRWFGLRDDAFASQFRAMVDKLDLGDVVELIGFMGDPKPAYRSIDLLLASSWEEPASLVTLEAMATGRPVACFRGSGGPAEEVGDTGIVIDEFSPAAMAAAIADLAGSPDRMRELGQAAYQRAAGQYTSDGRAERILSVIREVSET
jgi:glycosyltransferase involved in cell wall biosynthesis